MRSWQDLGIMVAGVWLLMSPLWMPTYADAGHAAVLNSYIVGLLLVVASWIALLRHRLWEGALNTLLGVWLAAAPFALGFENAPAATLNHIVIGLIVAADAMLSFTRSRPDGLGATQHR